MSDRDQTLERQAARYRVFKQRPWLGIWLLLLGIGIPGVTAVAMRIFIIRPILLFKLK